MATVYIVEDQRAIAQGMERVIGCLGHRAEVFHDGLEAYARVFEQPPDLLILDVLLPSLNGLALARLVKFNEDLAVVPVMVVSSITEEVEVLAREARVDAVLQKPFDPDAFFEEVERLLRQ